jgi:hypothetical protein
MPCIVVARSAHPVNGIADSQRSAKRLWTNAPAYDGYPGSPALVRSSMSYPRGPASLRDGSPVAYLSFERVVAPSAVACAEGPR